MAAGTLGKSVLKLAVLVSAMAPVELVTLEIVLLERLLEVSVPPERGVPDTVPGVSVEPPASATAQVKIPTASETVNAHAQFLVQIENLVLLKLIKVYPRT